MAVLPFIEEAIGPVCIEEALLPLAIVTTDISTGERVTLREGPVAQAVQASTCLPGLYTPVPLNGHLLVERYPTSVRRLKKPGAARRPALSRIDSFSGKIRRNEENHTRHYESSTGHNRS